MEHERTAFKILFCKNSHINIWHYTYLIYFPIGNVRYAELESTGQIIGEKNYTKEDGARKGCAYGGSLRRENDSRHAVPSLTSAKRANDLDGTWGALFLRLVSISKSICCFGGQLCAPPPCALSARATAAQRMRFSRCTGPRAAAAAPSRASRARSGWKKSPRESVACPPSVANPQLASRARFATRPGRIEPSTPFFALPSFGLRNFLFLL